MIAMESAPAATPAPQHGGLPDPFRHVVFVRKDTPSAPPAARTPRSEPVLADPGEHRLPITDFLATVCRTCGVDPDHYRVSIFRRRRQACLRAIRARCPDAAQAIIQRNPRAVTAAFGALMIGVTGFFRDPLVFQTLADILPGLAVPGRGLRATSVGCSDGSELYSLAMLLAESRALKGADLRGIDCRSAAVQVARSALYPASALEHVPENLRRRYFQPSGELFTLHPRLQRVCHWHTGDAAAAPLPKEQDVIFCRNLAIYLTTDAAAQLWRRLADHLRPGGVLVVGKAEQPRVPGLAKVAPCIYRTAEGPA
jgi:chemotaxis protein methyltransferase CheR